MDFHSLRRTFATFYEHAQAGGVSEATEIVRKDLMGHDRGDVTSKSYVGRNLGWDLYSRAVDGVVRVGMPQAVRDALEETAGNRPPLPGKVTAAPRDRPNAIVGRRREQPEPLSKPPIPVHQHEPDDERSAPIGKRFGRLKAEMGFGPEHVFHSIRKTVATLLEDAQCPEGTAADIIGHDKPTMTYGLHSGGSSMARRREWIEKAIHY